MAEISTKKITTAAAAAAISVAMSAVSIYLPLKIMPLLVSSIAFYIAFKHSGLIAGILAMSAGIALTFLLGGLSMTFIFLCVGFAPYSVLMFVLTRLNYYSFKTSIIRSVIILAFAFGVLYLCFYLMRFVAFANMEINLENYAAKLGSLHLLALLVAIAFVPLDYLSCYFSQRIQRILKLNS